MVKVDRGIFHLPRIRDACPSKSRAAVAEVEPCCHNREEGTQEDNTKAEGAEREGKVTNDNSHSLVGRNEEAVFRDRGSRGVAVAQVQDRNHKLHNRNREEAGSSRPRPSHNADKTNTPPKTMPMAVSTRSRNRSTEKTW